MYTNYIMNFKLSISDAHETIKAVNKKNIRNIFFARKKVAFIEEKI